MSRDLSHRTAIRRKGLSAPAVLLHNDGALRGRILDFGCGRGDDVRNLCNNGYRAEGYDPTWRPREPQGEFDTILCTYVLNTIENYEVRLTVLSRIAMLLAPGGHAFITVRRDVKGLGYTSKGTWQANLILLGWNNGSRSVRKRPGFETYRLDRIDCNNTYFAIRTANTKEKA